MQEAVNELGRQVSIAAQGELAQRSFGAVGEVKFVSAVMEEDGGESHWRMRWEVDSAGIATDVALLLLPEFLETEPELLVSQFAALLVERCLGE